MFIDRCADYYQGYGNISVVGKSDKVLQDSISLKALLDEAPKFKIDNLADLYWNISSSDLWDLRQDYPNLELPKDHRAIWLEWNQPKLVLVNNQTYSLPVEGHKIGCLLVDVGQIVSLQGFFVHAHWMNAHIFYESPVLDYSASLVYWLDFGSRFIKVQSNTSKGLMILSILNKLYDTQATTSLKTIEGTTVAPTIISLKDADRSKQIKPEFKQEISSSAWTHLRIAFLALLSLHHKSTRITTIYSPIKLDRSRDRKNKISVSREHHIILDPKFIEQIRAAKQSKLELDGFDFRADAKL